MMNRRKVWKGRHRRNKRIRSPKLKSQLNQSPPMVKAAGKCPLISASPTEAPLCRKTSLADKCPHKPVARLAACSQGKASVDSPIKRRAIRNAAADLPDQGPDPDVDRPAIADLPLPVQHDIDQIPGFFKKPGSFFEDTPFFCADLQRYKCQEVQTKVQNLQASFQAGVIPFNH